MRIQPFFSANNNGGFELTNEETNAQRDLRLYNCQISLLQRSFSSLAKLDKVALEILNFEF